MSRWTIGRRIAAGYAALLVLLVVAVAVGTYALASVRNSYRDAHDVQESAFTALQADNAFREAGRQFRGYLLTGERTLLVSSKSAAERAQAIGSTLRAAAADGEVRDAWAEILQALDEWTAAADAAAAAKTAGRDAEALRVFERRTLVTARLTSQQIGQFVDAERGQSDVRSAAASGDASQALWTLVALAVITLALGTLIAFALARSVTRRLQQTIGTVASAAMEILAATTEQASGAAEQESAVHETSVTVDEVKQTVQVASEKATLMADTVQRTAEVSRDGQQAVDATVRGTRDAKARMETLAERILVLSEQGQAIGELIETVDDVAGQSNLLAVNAAIEAAKAGEAGRGFAVVAAEVKGLAEQSRQATVQVREILNEIQRATQAAVMAAEQGVKASETGESVAAEAGDAIRHLAQSLDEAADAAQQILASAQQQMAGSEQVGLAMRNIQEASTQNMTATRQVEQAARDLTELAQELTLLVGGTTAVRVREAAA